MCLGQSGTVPPFFYMYACFFSNLYVSLPINEFTMGVFQALNVAPTQVYPNTWASLQAFRLLCDVMCLHPTSCFFLSYYTSHPAKKASWHSLVGRSGSVLFDSFALSYKRFKERFLKVIIRSEATTCFFNSAGRSRFLLYWTRQPCDFKVWPRPTEGDDELEVLSLFDALPRKLPCRRLIGAYTEVVRWATVRVMSFCFSSVDQSILLFLTLAFFCFVEIMVQERPTVVSALDKHRQRAANHKGRRNIEVLPSTKGPVARADKGSAGPS